MTSQLLLDKLEQLYYCELKILKGCWTAEMVNGTSRFLAKPNVKHLSVHEQV